MRLLGGAFDGCGNEEDKSVPVFVFYEHTDKCSMTQVGRRSKLKKLLKLLDSSRQTGVEI